MSNSSASYTSTPPQTTSQNLGYSQAPHTVPNSQSSQSYNYNTQTTLTGLNNQQQAPPLSSANESSVPEAVQTFNPNSASHISGVGSSSSSRPRRLSSSSSKGSKSLSNSATNRSLAEVRRYVLNGTSVTSPGVFYLLR